jgi:hypothetical protein
MKSDFEGDVASPLARFRPFTRVLVKAAALAAAGTIAMGFDTLRLENEQLQELTTARCLVSPVLLGLTILLGAVARRNERGSTEVKTLRLFLCSIVGSAVFVETFVIARLLM